MNKNICPQKTAFIWLKYRIIKYYFSSKSKFGFNTACWINFQQTNFEIFFLFFPRKLILTFQWRQFFMKFKILRNEKNKKNITSLLSAEFAQSVVKVNSPHIHLGFSWLYKSPSHMLYWMLICLRIVQCLCWGLLKELQEMSSVLYFIARNVVMLSLILQEKLHLKISVYVVCWIFLQTSQSYFLHTGKQCGPRSDCS